jgi:hypothetical protein
VDWRITQSMRATHSSKQSDWILTFFSSIWIRSRATSRFDLDIPKNWTIRGEKSITHPKIRTWHFGSSWQMGPTGDRAAWWWGRPAPNVILLGFATVWCLLVSSRTFWSRFHRLSLILFDVLILLTGFLIKSYWKHRFTKTRGNYQYKPPILWYWSIFTIYAG